MKNNKQNIMMVPFRTEISHLDSKYPMHKHEYSQLWIITKGNAVHIINNQEYKVNQGHVYVINEGYSHGFKDADNLEMYTVFYSTEKLMQYAGSLENLPGFQALFVLEPFYKAESNGKNNMMLDYTEQKFAFSILNKMLCEYNEKNSGFDIIFNSYFLILITFLSRQCTPCKKDVFDKTKQIAQVVSFLESNYTKKINVDELAQKACLSTRQFTRIFKENYNTTPMNHILQLRIKHACYLLRNTNQSITEIASDCGFVDSNYFSKQFKKITNTTPSKYKKEK